MSIHFLLSLPAPVGARSQPPMRVVGCANTDELNGILRRWWRDRCAVGRDVREIQRALWFGQGDPRSLLVRLQRLARSVASVGTTWRQCERGLQNSVGSVKFVVGEFVPMWESLESHPVYAWRVTGERAHPRQREHIDPTLVYESIMMCHLGTAIAQQCGTLRELAWRDDNASAASGGADLSAALTDIRYAIAMNNQIIEQELPRHFASLHGNETHYLAAHFYNAFVARLLESQLAYVAALDAHQLAGNYLSASVLFERSAQRLATTITDGRDLWRTEHDNAKSLYARRRAASLHALSQYCDVAESVIEYDNGRTVASPARADDAAALTESFCCSVAAAAANTKAYVMRERAKQLGARLVANHRALVPRLETPPPIVVIEDCANENATNVRLMCQHQRPSANAPAVAFSVARHYTIFSN